MEKITEGADNKEYTGGMVIAIMFSVIFGAFNLGGAVPHAKSLAEGRIAGKMAWKIMEVVPKVDPNAKGSIVEKSKLQGKITFRDVCFSYPTRAEE